MHNFFFFFFIDARPLLCKILIRLNMSVSPHGTTLEPKPSVIAQPLSSSKNICQSEGKAQSFHFDMQ